jgi:hypothetical protein
MFINKTLQLNKKECTYNLNLLLTKSQSRYREENKDKEILNIIPKGKLTLMKTYLLSFSKF